MVQADQLVKSKLSRNILITAGASGIGKSMAEEFSSNGDDVWIVDKEKSLLENCPKTWKKSCLDVSEEKSVLSLFKNIKNDWGKIDVLCANAGIKGPTSLIEDTSFAEWKNCLDVNIDGVFLFSKLTAPLMKKEQSGSIIITSSTAGIFGFSHRSPYVTSKWAVIGLMKSLAIELGPYNVNVNAICPGSVEGDRLESVIDAEVISKGMSRDRIYKAYTEGTSLKKLISPRDIADMAFFLAGQKSKLVSGQVIAVDGHTEVPDPKF